MAKAKPSYAMSIMYLPKSDFSHFIAPVMPKLDQTLRPFFISFLARYAAKVDLPAPGIPKYRESATGLARGFNLGKLIFIASPFLKV